jgi:hypothetical protein
VNKHGIALFNWATFISGALHTAFGLVGINGMGICSFILFLPIGIPFLILGVTNPPQSLMLLMGILLLTIGAYTMFVLNKYYAWEDVPVRDKVIAGISVIAGLVFAFLFIVILVVAFSGIRRSND